MKDSERLTSNLPPVTVPLTCCTYLSQSRTYSTFSSWLDNLYFKTLLGNLLNLIVNSIIHFIGLRLLCYYCEYWSQRNANQRKKEQKISRHEYFTSNHSCQRYSDSNQTSQGRVGLLQYIHITQPNKP